MKTLEQLQFDNSYAQLPDNFYSRTTPLPLADQHLISFNTAAATLIQLDPGQSQRADFVDYISGKKHLPGYDPLAMCYSGHQFGHYVPQLGDGRAILLGQVKTDTGEKWDLHLKGAGPTAYSRGSDGRAVLRSTIREYLCSEAMHGLGIATTRALCIIGSDHEVYREQIEKGAMLLRMAPSHIRFGSFEYYYYRQQFSELKQLADYVIQQHYPHFLDNKNPCLELLDNAVDMTAKMIAQWQCVGFSHGVMNSDNMSIHGLTLDYGPYGFQDGYQHDYICNHSDHHGRYAFNKQPEIGLFNLSCLAQALLPLLDDQPEAAVEKAQQSLAKYQQIYTDYYAQLMRNKLGLYDAHKEDRQLCQNLLDQMHHNRIDFTIFFRAFSQASDGHPQTAVRELFIDREAFDHWMDTFQQRINKENMDIAERCHRMKKANPKFILRNHMAETAIRKARDENDYSEIDILLKLLQNPFDEHPDHEHYSKHPPAWAQNISLSCSS